MALAISLPLAFFVQDTPTDAASVNAAAAATSAPLSSVLRNKYFYLLAIGAIAVWRPRAFGELLRHMEEKGFDIAVPRTDPGIETLPFLDFTSGYVQRALPRRHVGDDGHQRRQEHGIPAHERVVGVPARREAACAVGGHTGIVSPRRGERKQARL